MKLKPMIAFATSFSMFAAALPFDPALAGGAGYGHGSSWSNNGSGGGSSNGPGCKNGGGTPTQSGWNKSVNVYKPVNISNNLNVTKNIDNSKNYNVTKNIDNSKNYNVTKNIDNSKWIDNSKNVNVSKTININSNNNNNSNNNSSTAIAAAVAAAVAAASSNSSATNNNSVVVNAGASSGAFAGANSIIGPNVAAAVAAGSQFGGGGGAYISDQGMYQGGNFGAISTEAPPEKCTFQEASVVKAIHAVCVSAGGREFPASHMLGATWLDASYEGEVMRCIPGSHLRVTVGEVVQSDQGMASSFTQGQQLNCAEHEALRHYKDGLLKCAIAVPVPDCTERTNLRRWGTADMFFSYRTKVCAQTHREYSEVAEQQQ